MNKAMKKVTVELTLEQLDLIRRATWALEEKLGDEIVEYNKDVSEHGHSAFLVRNNEISKDMYFDSKALRTFIIKANSKSSTYDESEAYRKEHGLSAGDISAKYSNTES